MRLINISFLLIFLSCFSYGQNKTDISLFLKENPDVQLSTLESESGDMYQTAGHHGPAVENQWYALRLYFDKKAAIDVYSKTKPGLELKAAKWYPTEKQQNEGWGADYYKAGSTVGLGGFRLWDGEKVIPLEPVTKRTVWVKKEKDSSWMEMLSEGVPYKNTKVDVRVRVTVYSDKRISKVEASVSGIEEVQFVTGINYHEGHSVQTGENFIATWGLHPEDVAANPLELGGAIVYNPDDYIKKINDGKQYLLISKPAKNMTVSISTANANEKEINTLNKLVKSLQ